MKRLAAIFSLSLLLAACATSETIDLRQGKSQASSVIQSSKTVVFKYVDDDPVATEFVGQTRSYAVTPGQHTVLLEYADLFELSADEHDKVVSRPAKVSFITQAGNQYQISNDPYPEYEQAKQFALEPDFWVINLTTGEKVDARVELSRPRSFLTQLRTAAAPEYEFESDQVNPAAVAGSTTALSSEAGSHLEAMQQLWKNTPDTERDAFLKWVEQSQP